MKTCLTVFAVLLLAPTCLVLADEKKADSPVPGKQVDFRAFGPLLKVTATEFDDKKKQLTWTLETRSGVRTLDFVRDIDKDNPYYLFFLDADGGEVARVHIAASKFVGIPKDKVMEKGTILTVTVDVPDVLSKTRFIVLRRGKAD